MPGSSSGLPKKLHGAAGSSEIKRSGVDAPAREVTLTNLPPNAVLPPRSACESCRSRKLKCDGSAKCARCIEEGKDCVYKIRKPIGRPKKRKGAENDMEDEPRPSPSSLNGGAQRANGKMSGHLPSSAGPLSHTLNGEEGSKKQRSDNRQSVPVASPGYPATPSHEQPSQGGPFQSPRAPYGLSQVPAEWDHRHPGAASSGTTSTATTASSQASPWSSMSSADTSLNSEAGFPHLGAAGGLATADSASPNLDNLAVAAFLNSLDTLEIGSSDGLTIGMINAWPDPLATANEAFMSNGAPSSSSATAAVVPTTRHSSAMDKDVSYAVPADFSWWNPTWLDQTAGSSHSAAAQNLLVSEATREGQQQHMKGSSGSISTLGPTGGTLEPAWESPRSWPRGVDGGMGQGELRTSEGVFVGTGWQGHGRLREEVTQGDSVSQQPSPASTSIVTASANAIKDEQCPVTGAPGCCCGAQEASLRTGNESLTPETAKGSKSTPSVAGSRSSHSHSSSSKSSGHRVHCVPNPSGKGCTCLCDVSVALLSVRATLRAADQTVSSSSQSQHPDGRSSSGSANYDAARERGQTLHLTLSASQAVSAQCACSADCPTCRSDPSTKMSAGLLISTALQIYARAVSTLRQGFGLSSGTASSTTTATQGSAGAPTPEWDIRIGSYRPSPVNARRIALFAMRCELKDLRDALGKVSAAADRRTNLVEPIANRLEQSQSQGSERADAHQASTNGELDDEESINPVDQLVIRKLHSQLGELLRTVEELSTGEGSL
ncbi:TRANSCRIPTION FACTOR PDR1-RELATED [Ceraceosorus bombacis]|uniref:TRANSCRIPTION FACTOR PDR1-RELATED n=1 Tax=Ceraceosorus bombacis TaxID=401625 RepID=A0A0P1BDT8_9BASI|nr:TRANSCRIPTION FACTOR PDR1-RELATED [Ceraceosorus bombacis]